MVALHVLREGERTRAHGPLTVDLLLVRVGVRDPQEPQEIPYSWPGLPRLDDCRELVGCLDRLQERSHEAGVDRSLRWIPGPQEVVLDVLAGEFAARVELHALSQRQDDLCELRVGR